MTRHFSKMNRLNEARRGTPISTPGLMAMRNKYFGFAALCLGLLLGIAQMADKADAALQVSIYSASIALPLWVVAGMICELYILLGEASYSHLRTHEQFLIVRTTMIATSGLIIAAGGIIYFLNEDAFGWFVTTILVAFTLWTGFYYHLAAWWYSPTGPGSSEESP